MWCVTAFLVFTALVAGPLTGHAEAAFFNEKSPQYNADSGGI